MASLPLGGEEHASIARDNITIALSDMIDTEYLDMDDAKEIALMWLRENANEFFCLGLSDSNKVKEKK